MRKWKIITAKGAIIMRKLICGILCLVLVLGLCGCSTVGELAQGAADAAVQELEKQVKQTLEKNKVEMVQMKTAFGKLNDDGGKLQMFCAVFVLTRKQLSFLDRCIHNTRR